MLEIPGFLSNPGSWWWEEQAPGGKWAGSTGFLGMGWGCCLVGDIVQLAMKSRKGRMRSNYRISVQQTPT